MSALGILGAACFLLAPTEARAEDAQAPPTQVKVELETGIGGKVPVEGFTPFLARIENASDHDLTLILTVKGRMHWRKGSNISTSHALSAASSSALSFGHLRGPHQPSGTSCRS